MRVFKYLVILLLLVGTVTLGLSIYGRVSEPREDDATQGKEAHIVPVEVDPVRRAESMISVDLPDGGAGKRVCRRSKGQRPYRAHRR